MICKIDDFILDDIWVEEIDEELDLNFAEISRVDNNPYYQDIGGVKESFTIKGNYIKQNVSILKALEEIAKNKTPVRYTTLKDSFLVVITSIKKNKSIFAKGIHFKQGFEISLKRWYF